MRPIANRHVLVVTSRSSSFGSHNCCKLVKVGTSSDTNHGPLASAGAAPEEQRIRGFRLVKRATETLRFDQPRLYYVPAEQAAPVGAAQS